MTSAEHVTGERPEGVALRRMVAADVNRVLEIENASYDQPWPREAFVHKFEAAHSVFFVASDGVDLVGYAALGVDARSAHVLTVAVDPQGRRQGAGRALMLALLHEALRAGVSVVRLEVAMSNRPARSLYERLGFSTTGVRSGYYADGDALLMDFRAWDRLRFPPGRRGPASHRPG